MKKLNNIKGIKPLKRSEQAAINGGFFATCVAACGDTAIMCQGSTCKATDNIGCLSDIMIKSCPTSPALSDVQDKGN